MRSQYQREEHPESRNGVIMLRGDEPQGSRPGANCLIRARHCSEPESQAPSGATSPTIERASAKDDYVVRLKSRPSTGQVSS